jgi:hypothetical protein
MDNVTVVRIIAGVMSVILFGIIIARRKRMASTKRLSGRR